MIFLTRLQVACLQVKLNNGVFMMHGGSESSKNSGNSSSFVSDKVYIAGAVCSPFVLFFIKYLIMKALMYLR